MAEELSEMNSPVANAEAFFGKFTPDAPGHRAPPPSDGFHDPGEEADPLALALRVRILVATLAVLIKSIHGITIARSVSQCLPPQTTGDGKIPGGWRTGLEAEAPDVHANDVWI